MKKTLYITALALAIVGGTAVLSAQSNETRSIAVRGNFNAVSVSGSHVINFQTGPAGEPLTVIGDAGVMDNVEIYVKSNTLYVKNKDNRNNNKPGIQVYVKNPNLKSVSSSGSSKVIVTGGLAEPGLAFGISGSSKVEVDKIDCSKLIITSSGAGTLNCLSVKSGKSEINSSGSSRISIDGTSGTITTGVSGAARVNAGEVASGTLDVTISGSGRVAVSGSADRLNASLSGAGSLDAADVRVKDVDAKLSGSSRVSIECSGELKVSLSGASRLEYTGSPASVKGSGNTKNIVKR